MACTYSVQRIFGWLGNSSFASFNIFIENYTVFCGVCYSFRAEETLKYWCKGDLIIVIMIIIIIIIIVVVVVIIIIIMIIIIMVIIIITNLIHIAQFNTNGILTTLYIVTEYIQTQYMRILIYMKQSYCVLCVCVEFPQVQSASVQHRPDEPGVGSTNGRERTRGNSCL